MAENTKTETKTTTSSSRTSKLNFSKIMNAMSYVAVVIGGIALLLAMILGKIGVSLSLVSALQKIANIIAWTTLCILSSNFIKTKKKLWMWIVWAIALCMIIVGIILA